MTDAGLAHLLRRILTAPTKATAEKMVDSAGADYVMLAKNVVARLTFKRTLSQNALLHVWFEEIARHEGDKSALDVKGECHQRWAVHIRMRDPVFAWIWKNTGAKLDYEKQCKLLAAPDLAVSSAMTVKQLSEYMNEIEQHYRPKGVALTMPEREAA